MRHDFGTSLRRERERRGISLQEIAERTKIRAWFFAALERNDVSRWPEGIFRRAFLRAYADAVGLDANVLLPQFERCFPAADTLGDFVPAATDGLARRATAALSRLFR